MSGVQKKHIFSDIIGNGKMILSFVFGLCFYLVKLKRNTRLALLILVILSLLIAFFSMPAFHMAKIFAQMGWQGLSWRDLTVFGLPLSYPFAAGLPYEWGSILEKGLIALYFGNVMLFFVSYWLYTLGETLTLLGIYLCLFLLDLTAGLLGFMTIRFLKTRDEFKRE